MTRTLLLRGAATAALLALGAAGAQAVPIDDYDLPLKGAIVAGTDFVAPAGLDAVDDVVAGIVASGFTGGQVVQIVRTNAVGATATATQTTTLVTAGGTTTVFQPASTG